MALLTDEEVEALDAFRESIIDNVRISAEALKQSLTKDYPNMDVDYFVDMIDDVINDFTYEVIDPDDFGSIEDDDLEYND